MPAISQHYLLVCCLKRRTHRTEHTNYYFNLLLRTGVKLLHSHKENTDRGHLRTKGWREYLFLYRDGGENYVIRNFIVYLLGVNTSLKANSPQLVQIIPGFCGTWKFIAVFTAAFQLPIS
jgi:hypothetical protein